MQRIAYTVERIEPSHYPLPVCKNAQTPNWVQPAAPESIYVTLRFPRMYEIKRIMFKAGGVGFVEVSAGVQLGDIHARDKWRCLVPCTQLVRDPKAAAKLLAEREPAIKPKIWEKFGRYVAPPGQGFAFAVLRLDPLVDGPQTIGFQWIEFFGSAVGEHAPCVVLAAGSKPTPTGSTNNLNPTWRDQEA